MQRNDSFYKKLTDFKTYSKLQSQLKEKQSELAKIRAEQIPNNFCEPAEIIGRFNERMAKEWKETPYNKEEAVKYGKAGFFSVFLSHLLFHLTLGSFSS